jgi:hypothetical protein
MLISFLIPSKSATACRPLTLIIFPGNARHICERKSIIILILYQKTKAAKIAAWILNFMHQKILLTNIFANDV